MPVPEGNTGEEGRPTEAEGVPEVEESGGLDLLAVEATSFVVWMINSQRYRRDVVGLLAAHFAKDPLIRTVHLTSNLATLETYLCGHGAHRAVIEGALRVAYKEWRDAYNWYHWIV